MSDRHIEIAEMFKKYFHHYGFKKTSVDDVAAELHISKKTIYEYFDSKEAVFSFIIQGEAEQAAKAMSRRLDGITTVTERMQMLIHMIFDNASLYLKSGQGLDLHDRDDMANKVFQTAYESILMKVVEDGLHTGEFHLPDDDLSPSLVKSVIQRALQVMRQDPDSRVEHPTTVAVLKLLA